MLIRGGKIYYQQQLMTGYEVVINNDVISAVRPNTHEIADMILNDEEVLAPSFTDLHIHGARNKDVMDAAQDSLQVIADTLLEEGVTGFLATTMTQSIDRIEAALKAGYEFQATQKKGARVLGMHLEGPFLSVAHKGAQRGEHLKNPDIQLLQKWQKQFPGLIKLITIAPELPHALAFTEYACSQGIVVSIGHTAATFAETEQSINAGASHATHLYNAMSGLDHTKPGAALAILMDNRVTAELIVDGVHIMPEMVKFTAQCKGLEHLILITDAMRAKCAKAGIYDLGGQDVVVDDHGVARLKSNGKLAGSTLTLNNALKNMHKFTHLGLEKILPLVTTQPLKILKITSSGTIAPGQKANLVILNKEFKITGVIFDGCFAYKN